MKKVAKRVNFALKKVAKNEYKSYVIIDFGNVSDEIKTLFEGDTSDIDKFLSELQVLTHTKFYERETLVIFDEVQMMPRARQLIKYLFFYTRYDEERIEIDFLIKRNNRISPVEVKSSKYGKHTSLSKFINKFNDRIGEKFILYQKDLLVKDDVVHMPLYMAWLL